MSGLRSHDSFPPGFWSMARSAVTRLKDAHIPASPVTSMTIESSKDAPPASSRSEAFHFFDSASAM